MRWSLDSVIHKRIRTATHAQMQSGFIDFVWNEFPSAPEESGKPRVNKENSPQVELPPASKRWASLHRHQSERSSCSSGKVPPSALALYPVYSYQRVPSDRKAVNPLLCEAERSDPLDMVMISAGVPKTRITSARVRTKRVRTPMFVVPGIVSYPCHSNKSKNPHSGEGDHPY